MKDLHCKLTEASFKDLNELAEQYACTKTDVIEILICIAWNCILNDFVNTRTIKAYCKAEEDKEPLTDDELFDLWEFHFNQDFERLFSNHIDVLR